MSVNDDNGDGQPNVKKGLSAETVNEIKAQILGIGYKRPPEHNRFKKGQSGNPKGRPRKTTLEFGGPGSAHDLVLQEAQRTIKVREDGEVRQMTTLQAVQRAQSASALKGNAFAQRHFIRQNAEAEKARRQAIEEDHQRWHRYVDSCREMYSDSERSGQPPPNELPHPDDVVFPDNDFVRFIGPCNEAEAKDFERGCRLRDVLFMQDALERWERRDEHSDYQTAERGSAGLLAYCLNEKLPPRLRLTIEQELSLTRRFDTTPKRQLLKSLFRGWREVGMPRRRGWMFPSGRAAAEMTIDSMLAINRVESVRDLRVLDLLNGLGAVLKRRFST